MPEITWSARTPNLPRPDIEHSVNFFDRDEKKSKIDGVWQKRLNSWHLKTLMTPKIFTKAWKLCWEPRVNHTEQLLAFDNKTITEDHELLSSWKDHFATLLNESSTMEQYASDIIEPRPNQYWMSRCPDLDELNKVISMSCDGMSPGAEGLHPEVNKREGRRLVKVLYIIMRDAWENLGIPCRLEGPIISHHLQKGWQTTLGNYFSPYKRKCSSAYCSSDYRPKWRISYPDNFVRLVSALSARISRIRTSPPNAV